MVAREEEKSSSLLFHDEKRALDKPFSSPLPVASGEYSTTQQQGHIVDIALNHTKRQEGMLLSIQHD